MFLEKLEIQGFKSFANKNVLVFPGMLDHSKRGITAIVGPNGSGKSNVADAVRWALGEQSMKTLRGKKAEDIIFSGSDKKGRLGMSEVSLFLNNEDRQAPLDYSEIVITRRLFRNGDSEYLINNNRSRLSDIQMLLAKSKFGQKTYSVIGQGMVEGFLNTSLSERKEFFDEATGVKQYQIKRDDSLNKLRSSYENLIQAQMLVSEIEPRLKSLTRQVGKLQKRGELEAELREFQSAYYSRIWHEINSSFKQYNREFLELEQVKLNKDKKLEALNREIENLKIKNGQSGQSDILQNDLRKAQAEKEEINRRMAKLEAQIEVKLEARGQFDAAYLLNREKEIANEKKSLAEEISNIQSLIEQNRRESGSLENEYDKTSKEIDIINNELEKIAAGDDASEIIKEINKELGGILKQVRRAFSENDPGKIKSFISKIKDRIKQALSLTSENHKNDKFEAAEARRQEFYQKLKTFSAEKEKVISKINDNRLRLTARSERLKLLKERHGELESQAKAVEEKLSVSQNGFSSQASAREQSELNRKLSAIEDKISGIQEQVNKIGAEEKAERDKLFALQHDIQKLQNEINLDSNRLNEIKINSTRFETKLEDLEIEIREELGSLKEIRESRLGDDGAEAKKDKIGQLKRQLELIGGIDPQIEEEYKETKERFDFLSGQINDLTNAVESLEKIIKELDMTIKEQFDKEFKLIENNFEKYFKILFNGGGAKIIKVMESSEEIKAEKDSENEGEDGEEKSGAKEGGGQIADIRKIKFLQKHNATGLAGIEIRATPPGKKIKSISMLSGGERALTAIALICAIISANPSPFVVLDEVDAALDEANSERLAKILDELSHKTQFIVITHNRASMRKANILYGVTMGDDGVSKLLSIKLDDAKAVAKV